MHFQQCVIELLRGSPNGLTATEIAQRLGTTAGSISSRLSKLAAYGIIGLARRALTGRGSRENLYQAPGSPNSKQPPTERSPSV
jgi:DNA-binding transcriptional regulator GbsR (MarR family)